jgi:hypothetical protein
MADLTTHPALKAGDVFDVFVFTGKRRGYLCKGTVIWNGSTQLLPYSMSPDRGGFSVNTSTLYDGVTFQGTPVYGYRRPVRK